VDRRQWQCCDFGETRAGAARPSDPFIRQLKTLALSDRKRIVTSVVDLIARFEQRQCQSQLPYNTAGIPAQDAGMVSTVSLPLWRTFVSTVDRHVLTAT
jgi:hypothetical protein